MVGGADIGAKILVGEDATLVTAFGLTSIFTGSIWSDSRQSRYMKWSRLERMGCLVRMLACVRRDEGSSGSCVRDGRTMLEFRLLGPFNEVLSEFISAEGEVPHPIDERLTY